MNATETVVTGVILTQMVINANENIVKWFKNLQFSLQTMKL